MPLQGSPVAPGRATGRVAHRPDLNAAPPEADRVAVVGRLDAFPAAGVGAWRGVLLGELPGDAAPPPGLPPCVAGLAPDLFLEGETVSVDGDAGRVGIDGVQVSEVVTAFLERADGRILLLKRSQAVGSFRGLWAGVSGYLEDPTAREQAVREIREETGISSDHLRLVAEGRPVMVRDGARVFVAHPMRFRVEFPEVRTDRESDGYAWVLPSEIARRPTVPKLADAWRAVERPEPRAAGEKR